MISLHPLFKSYGSKFMGSRNFPIPLPGSTIYEPFAGGAGYSLRYSDYPVVLWDINPQLQILWSWLIHSATSQDILDIPVGLLEGTNIRELSDLCEGQKLLLKWWQRTNNTGNCWTVSKWGSLPGQFTKNTRSRVAEEIHGIKHWRFQEPKWNEVGTWHLDPPYLYNYKYGVKDFDFQDYANKVNGLPSGCLIIACEAVCSKTQAVPDYLPFTFSHNQVTSRRKTTNNHHSKELTYIKYT